MISTVLIHVARWATCSPTLGTAARAGPTAGAPPSCWPRSRPSSCIAARWKYFVQIVCGENIENINPASFDPRRFHPLRRWTGNWGKCSVCCFGVCERCSAQTHIIMWNTHLAKVIFEVLTSNVESEVTKAQGILDWIEYLLDFGQKEQKDWPRGDRMGNVLTTYLMIVPRPTQLDIISIL